MATMKSQPSRRGSLIARILAPLALLAAAIALIVVVSSSMSDSGETTARHHRHAAHGHHKPPATKSDTYVVQSGDTLGGIAEKTGVSVEELQRLNPDIDTQALVPGSTLKLR